MSRVIRRIDEETAKRDLSGKNIIVTGANSGVGLETTRQLLKQGAHVIMACRRVDAAEQEAKVFSDLKGSYKVMKLDLADLQSVREFAGEFKSSYSSLHGLVCNAGLVDMKNELSKSKDGLELTMQVSYYGHFLLIELLLDVLKNSSPSRIVLLSSVVHAGSDKRRPDINLNDMNFENRPYNNFRAYEEAKVASILYARELGSRLEGTGVSAFSVHPGWARSNFGSDARGMTKLLMAVLQSFFRSMTDSNEDSAQTTLHCLVSDAALKHNGAYFSQSSVLYRDKECKNGGWPLESPNPNVKDDKKAGTLVELTRTIVGLS